MSLSPYFEMPKDRRARSVSEERRSCASPFSYRLPSQDKHPSPLPLSENTIKAPLAPADVKEWEDARCPICMEHPHNAVMLRCSSNKKGCCAYMCDTSYRHSNCLDQFWKNFLLQSSIQEKTEEHVDTKLYCPFCRGIVTGWTVVEAARSYMNAKARNCSLETCTYAGTYEDLRKHARRDHPFLRPTQTDPERQRNWRRMEQQRDLGDLMSSMLPSLGMEEAEIEIGEFDEEEDLDMGENLLPASSFARVTLYIFIQFRGSGTPNPLQYLTMSTPRSATAGFQSGSQMHFQGEVLIEEASCSGGCDGNDGEQEESVQMHLREEVLGEEASSSGGCDGNDAEQEESVQPPRICRPRTRQA